MSDNTSQQRTISHPPKQYDYVIIGSGSAAFSAAIQAVGANAKTAIIERGAIGGTCVNIGCVPSKTMLRASEIHHLAETHPFLGIPTSAGPVDIRQIVSQKNDLVAALRQNKYIDLAQKYGFEIIHGEARFADPSSIIVNNQRITARNFLIATGASPAQPNIPGLSKVAYETSTSVLSLQELPKKIAIIGSGYIALELGQMLRRFGSEVVIMQRNPRLLSAFEPEISAAILQALTQQNIRVITGVTYKKVAQKNGIKQVYITVGEEHQIIESDMLIVAAGRAPNTAHLGLEAAQVAVGPRGEALTDVYLQTSNPHIYAAGDVTLGPQFVYVAAYEGQIAAANAISAAAQTIDLSVVPGVLFTTPGAATVGLTEEQARKKNYAVLTATVPLEVVPRALVNHETTGVVKLVADGQSRKILGAHIVAENAGEVIYSATLAVKFGLTIDDLCAAFAPYLTMAEGLKLAALAFDKDVSKLSCCAG